MIFMTVGLLDMAQRRRLVVLHAFLFGTRDGMSIGGSYGSKFGLLGHLGCQSLGSVPNFAILYLSLLEAFCVADTRQLGESYRVMLE